MIRVIATLIVASCPFILFGQSLTYDNSRGETHLAGEILLEELEAAPFQEWYEKSYNAFKKSDENSEWSRNLKDTQVEIYLGTWCGDSKMWVPKFVSLWESLGLSNDQLNFVALYDGEEKYKQGPGAEEKGMNIHRVPTFIFSKDGEEYARIVESPVNDLETDLAQIGLGYASEPNYRAATDMMELLATSTVDETDEKFKEHLNRIYRKAHQSKELNTLGYVYLRSERVREAVTTFMFNTYYFRYEPNVHDSYAEALEADGQIEQALAAYEKALSLNPDHEHAKEKVLALRGKD